MLKFVDDSSLVLLLAAAGLLFLVRYGTTWKDMPALVDRSLEHNRAEALPFLVIGGLMTVIGGQIALTWPLAATVPPTGNANIVIGWPALFFGVLFVCAGGAMCLLNGVASKALRPLCWLAALGGLMNLVLALSLLQTGLGQPGPTDPLIIQVFFRSAMWVAVSACSGIGAIISPYAIQTPSWRRCLMGGLILASGVVLLIASLMITAVHIQLFKAFPS